ncbi:relaxase/mobilization nuclease domain-containing protein [Streptococcus mitis]|uniref:Lipoprotein n=1 Tax=Streptococcus mitis TaxID=28037 RepID=A0A3R9K453_STRMT|nr:relaxase/mobilization nuclease domain-containing protein [Streptococcus mitis]RSI99573.1 hypothetical protein D8843_01860 [Streptococcus mitis]
MKKALITSAILLSATVLVACSNNQSATKDSAEQPKTEQSEAKETKASEKPASKKAKSLDDFKKALEDNGFTIEREQEKSSSLVQAKDGKGFVLPDGSSIEVYQYEENNPYFATIKKDKKLLDQPVTIYGDFVVMIVNPTDSKDKILDSFKGFE